MKEKIMELIGSFVRNYEEQSGITTRWDTPLVGFADAKHPDVMKLKETISDMHKLPSEILPEARIIIAYYVPFFRELADTNRSIGEAASPEWALAYEETNAMFRKLNDWLVGELEKMGYAAAVSPEAYTFDRRKLISNWSQRHIARAAGLGTFGANNMLITKAGCCGRYGTVVTNLDVEPDAPLKEEICIYKRNGRCGACFLRCPSGALTAGGYNRETCYRICRRNAERYTQFGSSYDMEAGGQADEAGSEVCGKCVSNVPCSFIYY